MIVLVRHALVDACGHYLAGRQSGVHLNTGGRRQAIRLGETLRSLPIRAVYSSPLERSLETATAIATGLCSVTVAPALNEVDFGEWTGLSFAALDGRSDW